MSKKKTIEREKRRDPAKIEFRIAHEGWLSDYLMGAPSQRNTSLGAAIDRNSVMGGDSKICNRCTGAGVLRARPPTPAEVSRAKAAGEQPRPEPACQMHELLKNDGDRAGLDWKGPISDFALIQKLAAHHRVDPLDLLRSFEPWCPVCGGNGTVHGKARADETADGIPANPTGSSRQPWRAFDAREDLMEVFAFASRVMWRVTQDNAKLERALVTYFGADGQRWAGSVFGAIFAVYPMTQAGIALLERSIDKAGSLNPCERIWQLAITTNPTEHIRILFDAAGTQAISLMTVACARWNRAAFEVRQATR